MKNMDAFPFTSPEIDREFPPEPSQVGYEVGDIFRQYGPAYRATHNLGSQQRKAMDAIETCRTRALGAHVDQCDHCGLLQRARETKMTIKLLDTVVLQTDLPGQGLRRGDVGSVVEVYETDGLEVEFVRDAGKTQALVTPTLLGCNLKYSPNSLRR